MYHSVKIHALSKPQVSRLLNQHGVKMKLGGALSVHVSKDQHKKLHKAHARGGAAVITFDPYQIDQHQSLRGEGVAHRIHPKSHKMKGMGTKLIDQSFTGNDVAHFLGAHESSEPLMNKGVSLNQVKDAGNRAKHFFGLGVRKRGRPKKMRSESPEKNMSGGKVRKPKALRNLENFFRPIGSAMVHDVMPAAGGILGGIAASELGPIGALAGAAAGRAAAQQAANALAKKTGLGLKKRGRPSKVGVGVGQKKTHHKKKAGRPRKGAALFAAGH
jgi:hypothetical protein